MPATTADLVLAALARYELRAKPGGRYLSNSPLRPGSNSHALSLVINGPEHGAYVDFVSGEKGSLYDLAAKLGIQTPKKTTTTERRLVATYDYLDEDGTLVYQACRYEPGRDGRTKDFTQRAPDGRGGWNWSMDGITRVLYHLPEVQAAVASGATVYIVEGEKDADQLSLYDLVATTNVGGAGKWRSEYSAALAGATIVILPDCDAPGLAHADAVAASLHGVAARVTLVELPGLPPKGDVSDWLAAGHTIDELHALVDATAPYTPPVFAAAPAVAPAEADATEDERATQAQRLIALGRQAELFITTDGDAYARCLVDGHHETWALRERGTGFRSWLLHQFYQEHGKPPSATALTSAVEVLEAQARFDQARQPVYTRVAAHEDTLYLDLADGAWRAIEIDAHGWRIIARPPVAFRRPRGMLPLPEPQRGGSLAELRPFLNVTDTDWLIIQGWLLGTLMPDGPYPHLALYGEMGSAKSTTTRLLRALIDPNEAMARSMPKEERDLSIAAKNSRIVAFDNLSYLPAWLSDALCRLSTGAASSTRALYSDDDEMLFSAKRPVIFNGIAEVATRGDLIDRTLTVMLQPIKQGHSSERTLWDAFYTARPRILGAILDAASASLRNRGRISLPWLPRLADFALWVECAAPHLGWPTGAFTQAMGRQREDAVAIEIEASLLAQQIERVMDTEAPWAGTATQLLDLLELSFELNSKGEAKTPKEGWPKDATRLAGELRRIAPAIRTLGYDATFAMNGKRQRIIHIDRCTPRHDRCMIAVTEVQRSSPEGHQDGSARDDSPNMIAEIAVSRRDSVRVRANGTTELNEEGQEGKNDTRIEKARDTAISAIMSESDPAASASARAETPRSLESADSDHVAYAPVIAPPVSTPDELPHTVEACLALMAAEGISKPLAKVKPGHELANLHRFILRARAARR